MLTFFTCDLNMLNCLSLQIVMLNKCTDSAKESFLSKNLKF